VGRESGGEEMESVAASGAADDISLFVQPMSCECPKTKQDNMNVFDAISRERLLRPRPLRLAAFPILRRPTPRAWRSSQNNSPLKPRGAS